MKQQLRILCRSIIPVLCALLLSVGCSKQQPAPYPTIPLGNSIGQKTGPDPDFTLNAIAEQIELIPIETSDTCLMARPRICGVMDTILVLEDRHVIYLLHRETGAIRAKIDKKGKGPGEYIFISDVVLDAVNSRLHVGDLQRKINTYDLDGKFIASTPADFVGGFNQLPDRNFAITYYPSPSRTECIGIFDSAWNKLAGYMPLEDKTQQNQAGLISIESINRYNGQCYYKSLLGDTLYRISAKGLNPVLVLDKGELQLPAEIAIDVDRKQERSKYIFGDYGYLADNFYFVSYYYDNQIYYDIWDLSTSTLVYRNVRSSPADPEGVALTVNKKKIYIWPRYIDENHLYCVVGADTGIVPTLGENSNPVIVRIKIRSSLL